MVNDRKLAEIYSRVFNKPVDECYTDQVEDTIQSAQFNVQFYEGLYPGEDDAKRIQRNKLAADRYDEVAGYFKANVNIPGLHECEDDLEVILRVFKWKAETDNKSGASNKNDNNNNKEGQAMAEDKNKTVDKAEGAGQNTNVEQVIDQMNAANKEMAGNTEVKTQVPGTQIPVPNTQLPGQKSNGNASNPVVAGDGKVNAEAIAKSILEDTYEKRQNYQVHTRATKIVVQTPPVKLIVVDGLDAVGTIKDPVAFREHILKETQSSYDEQTGEYVINTDLVVTKRDQVQMTNMLNALDTTIRALNNNEELPVYKAYVAKGNKPVVGYFIKEVSEAESSTTGECFSKVEVINLMLENTNGLLNMEGDQSQIKLNTITRKKTTKLANKATEEASEKKEKAKKDNPFKGIYSLKLRNRDKVQADDIIYVKNIDYGQEPGLVKMSAKDYKFEMLKPLTEGNAEGSQTQVSQQERSKRSFSLPLEVMQYKLISNQDATIKGKFGTTTNQMESLDVKSDDMVAVFAASMQIEGVANSFISDMHKREAEQQAAQTKNNVAGRANFANNMGNRPGKPNNK